MHHLFKNSLTRFFYGLSRTNPPKHGKNVKWSRQLSQYLGDLEQESWESMEGLVRCSANFVPLSPISLLERSAKVYRDRTSVVYGSVKYTWAETHGRCVKLASALTQLGISPGDVGTKTPISCTPIKAGLIPKSRQCLLRITLTSDPSGTIPDCRKGCLKWLSELNVATLAPNIPAMHELHFAVPMAGAVLCTLNTRHDSSMVSVLLKHSEAKAIFVDHQLLEVAEGALNLLEDMKRKPPILVLVLEADGSSPVTTTSYEYESLLATGCNEFVIRRPKTEWDPISINYTSGTTSMPKGVVYCHRGAYLNSIATVLLHGMGSTPVYLWTVPMFHCNGWCLIWGLAAFGGTNICLRRVSPKEIFECIALHKVTNMSGAPTVLNMIVNSSLSDRQPLPHKVEIMTGGSPPPPQILLKMEELGFGVSHLYGLTETYGPGTSCIWKPEWDSLPSDDRSRFKARQGVHHIGLEDVDVKDPITMENVPADGKTVGEIMFRGNTVMSGYLKDLKATEEAFKDGWFRSGDIAVKHLDGYIQVKDRSKDIIISGGENISTVEVETVLFSHPAVLEAAVVGRPDDHWGQTPCAFVKLKEGFNAMLKN
ncbi:hypothetical protein RJ639_039726 [Escallonia herrerae]|uniref:Acyl-activating enzyme 2 n=1 Tax=Escallonia herrerae TaxID=1293975 RepID=A0AA88WK02_9ASTE|nr:hypothetical protein RJ639_039726 [Escallonia herrerae]